MDDRPPQEQQLLVSLTVSFNVPRDLIHPIFTVISFFYPGLEHFPVLAMEELGITEYGYPVLCDSDIRLSGKSLIVFPVSYPLIPQGFSEPDFDSCVLPPDTAHIIVTLGSHRALESRFIKVCHR